MRNVSSTARAVLILALAALLGGGVLTLAASGTASDVGLVLLAIGFTLMTSFAFALVGDSEDRYRRRHPRG